MVAGSGGCFFRLLIGIGLSLVFRGRRTADRAGTGAGRFLHRIRFFRMAGGGAVTPGSMLPVMLFGAAYGLVPGLLVGFAYSLLQIVQGAEAAGFMGLLLDYILAFTALGLAGLAKNWPKRWGLYAAMLIALVCRLVCSVLSGVIVWGTPLWGSITYNVSYMLPEMVICLLLGMLIGPRIVKLMQEK